MKRTKAADATTSSKRLRGGVALSALVACALALVTWASLSFAAGLDPNTVGLSVYKKGTSTPISDADLQQLPMLDIDGGQVSVQMVPNLGETGPSVYKVVIPDYYSFQGVSPTGSNYTSAVVSTDTSTNPNAKNNVLTITIPAPANPQQPSQVSLSFNTVLNRNSIPKDKQDAWEAGTWNPNAQGTNFSITKPSDPNVKSEKPVQFYYTLPDAVAPTMNTQVLDSQGWKGDRIVLDAQGIPNDKLGNLDGTALPKFNFVIKSSDVFVSGPKNVKEIVVKAPQDMFFTGTFPQGCTGELSADKKTATLKNITLTPDKNGTLTLQGLEISPNPEYLNKENPFAKRFAPNTELPVTADFTYIDGSTAQANWTFKISDYTEAETAGLTARPGYDFTNKPYPNYNDGQKSHVIYDITSGGTKNNTQNTEVFSIYRPNKVPAGETTQNMPHLITPPDMGRGMKNVITFGDPDDPTKYVQVKELTVVSPNVSGYEQGLGQYKIKEIRYYTKNHPEGLVESNIPANSLKVIKVADPTDAITKVEIVYDAFIYVNGGWTQLIKGLKYDASPTAEQKVLVPIVSTIQNPQGAEVATERNNILINAGRDPNFGLFGTEGVTKNQKTFKTDPHLSKQRLAQPGTYGDGQEYFSYTFGIHDEKVGDEVGILDKLENVWFDNWGTRAPQDDAFGLGDYFTNGHVRLHKTMNDGNWTVEVCTISASDWAKNPKGTAPTKTQTFAIPAFSTDTYDLRLDQLANLQPGEMIYRFVFKYNGTLDISSMNEEGADRGFYDVYIDNLTHHPVLGTPFYGFYQDGYYAERAVDNHVFIKIDNTQEIDKKHAPDKYSSATRYQAFTNGQAVVLKGGDIATPRKVSASSQGSVLRQGGTTTVKMSLTYSGAPKVNSPVNPNSRLSVQKGWTAYLKLNPETLKYTAPVAGSAKIEGVVDPNSRIVEINGEKYLKVTYLGDEVEKAPAGSSYAPINIEWKSYSIPSAPVTKALTVVDSGYIDVSNKQEWTYEKDGVTYKTGIDSGTTNVRDRGEALRSLVENKGFGFAQCVNGPVVKDDPLGLHADKPAYERAFALVVPELKLQPNKDVLTGLTLVPGIEGEGFQNKDQWVNTDQEGKERVLISLIAGDADLRGLSTTIKLPRAGDSAQLDGAPVTQGVSQYLTGPVTRYQDPTNAASTKMQVKYSLDGGNTYVDETQVSDWSQVTHLQVTDTILKANDSDVLLIPLTTEHKLNNDGKASVGKAYWNALATIGEGGAETTRELLFSYDGHTISGAVWVDTNKDGNQNSGESLYKTNAVELKLMKGDEVVATTYTTNDGTAQGEPTGLYTFKEVADHEGLRVVMTAPDNYGITKDPAQGIKNKFSVAEPNTAVLPSPLADSVEHIDAGIAIYPKVITHIDAKKVLEGRSFAANEGDSFEFVLAPVTENAPMPEEGAEKVVVHNGEVASFGDMTFKQAGSYTYSVSETQGSAPGVTYDSTAKTVVVEVSAAEDGTLSATVTYPQNTNAATFTNTYEPAPTTLSGPEAISVQKFLEGRAWLPTDSFTFTLTAVDGAPMPATPAGATLTVTDGKVHAFGDITYTEAGDYKYQISETAGSIAGVTYDTHVLDVTVYVRDYNGALGAIAVVDNAFDPNADDLGISFRLTVPENTAYFKNTYDAAPVTITGETAIKAQKVLTGREFAADDSFEFVLSAKSADAPMPATGGEKITVTNGQPASFGNITYTKAGTYTYEVRETAGTLGGITYDTNAYEVTVTVTDNGQGSLVPSVSYPAGAAVSVTNAYAPEAVTITGETAIKAQKVLTGREFAADDSFEFVLSAKSAGAPMPAGTGNTTSVSNAEPASFGDITYTKAGTYVYEVRETQGNIAGVTYDEDVKEVTVTVTDDGAGNLSAAITYGADGATAAKFTNAYTAQSVTITDDTAIKAKKKLTGRAFKTGDSFEFVLAPVSDNAPMPAAGGEKITVSDAEPKSFGAITYTAAGTYTYKVTETAGSLGGITYDDAEVEVVVTVTDNGQGQLVASVSGVAELENTYEAAPVTLSGNTSLQVQKTLTGRAWTDADSFSFTVEPQGDAPAFSSTSATATKDATKVDFGSATFTKAGTYTYLIKETQGSIAGVTYDPATITATIEVTDNQNGQLVATTTYSNGAEQAEFTNSYGATSVTITGESAIKAKKKLTGRAFKTGDSFEFVLAPVSDNAPMPATGGETISVTDGTAKSFGAITYTAAGTYTYKVTETAGNLGGITYDDAEVEVTVTVTDNGQGQLVASVSGVAEFENTYEAAPVTLSGDTSLKVQKTFTGRAWTDSDSFTFTVEPQGDAPAFSEASVTVHDAEIANFGSATFDKAGTYTYVIAETAGTIPGVTYDQSSITATVTVTDNQNGQLVATTTYSNNAAVAGFTNTYSTGPVTISGANAIKAKKTLTGREFAAGDTFEFVLSAKTAGAPMPASGGEKITVTDGTAKSFGAITYTAAGTYTYKVTETAGNLGGITYDTSAKEVTVTVTDAGDGTLTATVSGIAEFENTYKAAPVTLSGNTLIRVQKTLSGRDWKDSDSFTFTATPQGTAPALENATVTVTNGEVASFGAATFSEAGTYTYTIAETAGNIAGVTYDTATITATVTVTDNGQGQLVAATTYSTGAAVAGFTNTYAAGPVTISGDTAIKVKKNLTGRAFKAGDTFEFVLSAKDNAPLPQGEGNKVSVTNGEPTSFGAITYTAAGTYKYEVRESAGTIGGITYDSSVKEVTVTVTDDGSGVLSASVSGTAEFTNTYEAAPVTLSGDTLIRVQKTLSGRDWKDGDSFTFTATPQDTAPALSPASVTVTNNQVASFGAATFTQAGTYTYTIAESAGSIPGITYDTHTVVATVTVTDNQDGQLVATTTYSGGTDKAEFVNTYGTDAVTISGDTAIKVKKTLTGREFAAGDSFEFVLSAKDNAPLPAAGGEKISVTDAEPKSFGAITYTAAGTYRYEVRETQGDIAGITYSDAVREVIVTVTDNGAGKLVAAVSGTAEFENTYKAAPVTLSGNTLIRVQKTLSGRDWKDSDSFTFTATPQGNAPALATSEVTVTNGDVASFGEATFDKAGTYTYAITETVGNIAGITYDQSTITATVTVTDNGQGQLVAATTYSTGAAVAGFTNTYAAGPVTISGNTAIKVKKTLTGRDFVASDAFEFVLTAKDGAPMPASGGEKLTATNGEATSFGAITYTAAGTYTYEVRETAGSLGGITYDESVKEITVTVTDEGDGALRAEVSGTAEFENTYKAEPVTLAADSSLRVRKTLEGREWRDDDAFEFVVEPLDGAPVPEMIRISATSTEAISFGKITFSEPGEYLYRISEVAGTEAGMTYDTMVVIAHVVVVDDNEGQLHATVTYSNGTATAEFVNTYVAPEVPQTPTKPAAPRKRLPAAGDTTGVSALITGAAGLVAATLGRVAKRNN